MSDSLRRYHAIPLPGAWWAGAAERLEGHASAGPSVLRRRVARSWRGFRRAAAPGPHLALCVKNVGQGRRFDPDIRAATDTFRGKRHDVAVEILEEGRPGQLQRGRVAVLRRDQHEDRPQQPGAAVVAQVVLLGGQQVGFLQQGVQPAIRQMLG
jgi:hypothetical protein